MRDATNAELQPFAQELVRSSILAAADVLDVENQWVSIVSLNPQQATNTVRLVVDGGSGTAFVAQSGSPFFVSGRQRLRLDTGAGAYVMTASRRELLSTPGMGHEYPENGAAFSEVYESGNPFAVSILSGQWAYLSPDFVWTAFPINTLPADAYQFGWAAPDKNKAGRFYGGEFFIVASAPATAFQLGVCGELQSTPVGEVLSGNLTANAGAFRIGDDGAALVAASVFAPADMTQARVLCPSKFALVLRPTAAVATTFTGEMKMIRRGF